MEKTARYPYRRPAGKFGICDPKLGVLSMSVPRKMGWLIRIRNRRARDSYPMAPMGIGRNCLPRRPRIRAEGRCHRSTWDRGAILSLVEKYHRAICDPRKPDALVRARKRSETPPQVESISIGGGPELRFLRKEIRLWKRADEIKSEYKLFRPTLATQAPLIRQIS